MTLPTREDIFRSALRDIDRSRDELSAAGGWLKSDWTPVGTPLSARASDARYTALRKITDAAAAIDDARSEILDALEDLG
ncbi:hypothetical protein [Nocardia asteroides]|uniref:hypothetical protein n=1 Tax=Nocardia asteroides TaxID=1824 RepID=UPI0033E35087